MNNTTGLSFYQTQNYRPHYQKLARRISQIAADLNLAISRKQVGENIEFTVSGSGYDMITIREADEYKSLLDIFTFLIRLTQHLVTTGMVTRETVSDRIFLLVDQQKS